MEKGTATSPNQVNERIILVYIILGMSSIREEQAQWMSERGAIWIHITQARQGKCNMDENQGISKYHLDSAY